MRRILRPGLSFLCLLMVCLVASAHAQTTPSTAQDILAKATDASVLILTGEGAGRLEGVATGVVIRTDGIILTAYHVIKDAHEVQVRLHNGEVYDHVELLGYDERRDVAAVKIAARGLATLPAGSALDTKVGDAVYAVTNAGAMTWSATQGILSAIRPADEVPGAGSGYRLVQFTALVAPGASGGALIGPTGTTIGIITRGNQSGAAFAVPIESVLGLADETQHVALGGGRALDLPKHEDSPSSAAVKSSQPNDILRFAKTASITSHSVFFTAISLDRALAKEKDFAPLGLLLVQDRRVADLAIDIDRPLFTYQWTYTITDPKTSLVLCSGKITAYDGETAAGPLAKDILKQFVKVRQVPSAPAPHS